MTVNNVCMCIEYTRVKGPIRIYSIKGIKYKRFIFDCMCCFAGKTLIVSLAQSSPISIVLLLANGTLLTGRIRFKIALLKTKNKKKKIFVKNIGKIVRKTRNVFVISSK